MPETTQEQPTWFQKVQAVYYLWSARIHRHYGLQHGDTTEFMNAVDAYRRALELNPYLSAAYLERGVLLWRELGRSTHAIRDLSHALDLSPNWPDALFNRGLAYQANGNFQAAIADFSAYLAQGDTKWREDAANQMRQIRILFKDHESIPKGKGHDA